MACKLTFSPYIPTDDIPAHGIVAGKLAWVSDQAPGGKRSVAKPWIAPDDIAEQNVKSGYMYMQFASCSGFTPPPPPPPPPLNCAEALITTLTVSDVVVTNAGLAFGYNDAGGNEEIGACFSAGGGAMEFGGSSPFVCFWGCSTPCWACADFATTPPSVPQVFNWEILTTSRTGAVQFNTDGTFSVSAQINVTYRITSFGFPFPHVLDFTRKLLGGVTLAGPFNGGSFSFPGEITGNNAGGVLGSGTLSLSI
jgi:hypothetical protein